ncbi:MAG TPA: hypothetical protein PLV96_00405 [Methanoregulaceae archaeon]|nr:hypothetical protein [Methanoregulaceae archaeon]HQN17581.1 hypothetical protein [Syntrophobacteraceae bacterium]
MGRLPDDLPGGWVCKNAFGPAKIVKGQIWRKCGPLNAIKVKKVMLPGHEEYDGALTGISVVHSGMTRDGRVVWERKRWFIPGTEEGLMSFFEINGYAIAEQENRDGDSQTGGSEGRT